MDEECPSYPYLECINSKCRVLSTCSTDRDCPLSPPYECVNSLCVKRRHCTTSSDCPFFPSYRCQGAQCIHPIGSCSDDSDCQLYFKRYCVNWVCIRMDLPCDLDQDCPYYPRTRCVNKACVKATATTTTTTQQTTTSRTTTTRKTTRPTRRTTTRRPAPTAPSTAVMTAQVRQTFVDLHNKFRSQVAIGKWPNGQRNPPLPQASNMRRMKWDNSLENSATARARLCSLNLAQVHLNENLHVATLQPSFVMAADEAVTDWFDEIKADGINRRVMYHIHLHNKPTACRGFLKAAWGNSYKLGCGIAKCVPQSKTYVVCHYSPQGLIIGQYIYAVGRPCSGCGGYPCSPSVGLCQI